jgi:hypothetical protein
MEQYTKGSGKMTNDGVKASRSGKEAQNT